MTDPLSPSALAQVPEVDNALEALENGAADVVGASEFDSAREMRKAEKRLPALRLAVIDAVLSAERQRLLGMTPEVVVEAAAKAMLATRHSTPDNQPHATLEGLWGPSIANRSRNEVRAVLPILLAPEVAKREAAERERDRAVDLVTQAVGWKDAAEAERDRLKAAGNAIEREYLEGGLKPTRLSGNEAIDGLRAALSGRDTDK